MAIKEKSSKSKSKSKEEKPKSKKVRYGVFPEEYKGTEVVAIREVDKEGEILNPEKFPIISIGKTKLKAIVACADDLKEALDNLE